MTDGPASRAASPWRFELLDRISEPGQSNNEDRGSALPSAAWVIDGVTGMSPERLFPGPSDAAWLAATADGAMRDLATFDGDGEALMQRLTAELGRACERAALAPLDESGVDLPAASIAVARLAGDTLETVMLSDCKIVLQHRDGPVTALDDSAVAPFDAAAVAALRRMQAAGETRLAALVPQLKVLIRENRRHINRPGGYGVLSADPAGLAFVETARWPASDVTHVLLASDGFYRLVDTYHAMSAAELLDAAAKRGLAPLYDDLRRIEDADPECLNHPRLKPRDDATALLLRLVRSP